MVSQQRKTSTRGGSASATATPVRGRPSAARSARSGEQVRPSQRGTPARESLSRVPSVRPSSSSSQAAGGLVTARRALEQITQTLEKVDATNLTPRELMSTINFTRGQLEEATHRFQERLLEVQESLRALEEDAQDAPGIQEVYGRLASGVQDMIRQGQQIIGRMLGDLGVDTRELER